MTTNARQRLGSILGVAIMVATAAASGGGARAADNGAAASQSQRSEKTADATKRQDQDKTAKTDGNAALPPAAPKASSGPRTETRRGRGHF